MKFTTTLVLALVLAVLGMLYLSVRRTPAESPAEITAPEMPAASVAQALIEEDLGEVVRISVKRTDEPGWVFEKAADGGAGPPNWRIVEPFQGKATGWELDRLVRTLTGLKYEVAHEPGAPGSVSPADADLEPPRTEVTLTAADGVSATIEIGRPASRNQSFARLAGRDAIVVAKTDARSLLKDEVVEYRDPQAWNFAPENVRRLEIVDRAADGGPVEYSFVKEGVRWMLEAPVSASATDKVKEAVQTISRLRMSEWTPGDPDRLGIYGLDPAAVTIRVTTEEQVAVEDPADASDDAAEDDAADAPPETELRTTVYTLHMSDLSPIGEETQTYARLDDEVVVGTLPRTTADKLRPRMNEWRDMRIITADVGGATGLELRLDGDAAKFVKTPDGWTFASDGEPAEAAEIERLLTSLSNLDAVVFLDATSAELASFGLETPRAEVRLTLPGGEETLAIGAYTDERARRLVYARRGSGAGVAKVRAADVETLLQPIAVYRNRTVLDLDADRIERLALRTENPFSGGPSSPQTGSAGEAMTIAFERSDGKWVMVEPAEAPLRQDRVMQLVSFLSPLKATTVLPDDRDAAGVGLDEPDAVVAITYRPLPADPVETGSSGGDEAAAESAEAQPPAEQYELALSARDAGRFAKLTDHDRLYEIPANVYDQIHLEYRSADVLEFDPANVTAFSIENDGAAHAFERTEDGWVYVAEPDLPLSTTKVEKLLLDIKDSRTERYAAHDDSELAAYGLDQPATTITLKTNDGREHRLLISARRSDATGTRGYFAKTAASPGVFVLPDAAAARLSVKLADLEAA